LGAASITLSQSDNENKDMTPLCQYCPQSMDQHAIQPLDSTIPLSVLRFSLESSFTGHGDSVLSPYSERKAYSGS